jgi:hypothetical protein
MKISTTYTFELELALTATYSPAIPERGPTYACGGEPCGGEPAEAASVEDVTVEGVGIVQSVYSTPLCNMPGKIEWRTVSLLDGVGINSPDIQRLFDNMLKIVGEDAEAVLLAEADQ